METGVRQSEANDSQERAALFGSLFCSVELEFLNRACHWLSQHFTSTETEMLAPAVLDLFSNAAEPSKLVRFAAWPDIPLEGSAAGMVVSADDDSGSDRQDGCGLEFGDHVHARPVCRYELRADQLKLFLSDRIEHGGPHFRLDLRQVRQQCPDISWREQLRSERLRLVMERSRIELGRYCESKRRSSELSMLQSAISCFPGLVFAKDMDLRYVVVNKTLCEYNQLSAAEVCGKRFEELSIGDPQAAIDETDRLAVRGEHVSLEHELVYAGNPLCFLGQKAPILDNDGTQIGICGVYQDITALRQAETRLRQANAFQAALIEKASEGVVVARFSERGRKWTFLLWNRRVADITGIQADDEHRAERIGRLFSSGRISALKALARLNRGQHLDQEQWKFSLPDGRQRVVVVSTASMESDGTDPVVVFFINDITRRDHILRTLEEHKNRYELATRHSNTSVWECNARTGIIAYCTMAETLGYIGRTFANLDEWYNHIHPEDQPEVIRAWDQFTAQEIPAFHVTMRMRHASGGWRWIDCHGRFFDNDPKTELVVGTDRDITDQVATAYRIKHLQDEMQEISRLTTVSEMAASLAHEITQPVTAIRSYSAAARKLLDAGNFSREDVDIRRYVGKIEENAKNATEIMHIVRSLCSPAAMELSWNELGNLVDKALEVCQAELHKHEVEVRRVRDSDHQRVRVSAPMMVHVLMNLISNACDALKQNPPGERVLTLATGTEAEKAVLLLSDNGPGILPGILNSLFQPFVTTKPNGMGVGLAICKRIMEAHNGEISVREHVNPGVTFCLRFE